MAVTGAYGDTGYVLCGLPPDYAQPAGGWGQPCDRRRNHQGRHSWQEPPFLPRPPHGCLEDRVAALEKQLKELERRVSSHDGLVYGGGR